MGLMHNFDPETAHRMTIAALRFMPAATAVASDARLSVQCAGLDFPNPVLLAAGFDKDAMAAHAMPRFGFGGAEVGTLTPLPQTGNPRPRLFRLTDDRAVINRMGFNNGGQSAANARLERLRNRPGHGLIGVNIGANKDASDRIADYATGISALAHLADWMTVNISSPNTPGLRALQDEGALDALLSAVAAARAEQAAQGVCPPVFLKVAPDLEGEQIGGVVRSAIEHGIDAIIIGNTTISRPPLASRDAGESGGLSGAPLADLALARLKDFRAATGGQMPLIAAGGISSADHVWERLRAGASLVQLYSALVYEGPWLAARINAELKRLCERHGVARLSDIIGADVAA
jgi:dihydroorotate dehydrogenase